jgi:hypothetical protein
MTDFAALPVQRVRRVMSFADAERMVGAKVPELAPSLTRAGLLVDDATGEPFLAYYPLPAGLAAPVRPAVQEVEWTSTRRAGTGERNWDDTASADGEA